MTWIDDQWFDSARAAMAEMFAVDPSTKSQMIQFLLDEGFWDSERLSWDAAVTRFNACLNPNKRDAHFKISEVWAIAKRFERPHLFIAIVQDLGYDVIQIPTEARRQQLLERIARASEECTRVIAAASAELERLPSHGAAQSTKTRSGTGLRPLFSKADTAP